MHAELIEDMVQVVSNVLNQALELVAVKCRDSGAAGFFGAGLDLDFFLLAMRASSPALF